jgi:hypothetical protein
MQIDEYKHPNYKKELGKRSVEIDWIIFRENQYDEYFSLGDETSKSGVAELPNNWGYIFTPWGAYLVEPKNIYRVYDENKGIYTGRRVSKKDLKFFDYSEIKKNPITDLILQVKDTRFKRWTDTKYKTGKKEVKTQPKYKKIIYLILNK